MFVLKIKNKNLILNGRWTHLSLIVLWLCSVSALAQKRAKKKPTLKVPDSTVVVNKQVSPKRLPPTRLRIMSYNLTNGATENGKTNIVDFADAIKQFFPDIVAIQALDSGAVRSGRLNQLKILALLTGYDTFFTKTTDLESGIHGIAILTRHDYQVIHNRLLPSPENGEPRYMQSILVEIAPGRHIHLVNTVLDDYSPMNRGLQAAFVNGFLRNSIYPVVLTGNFGTTVGDHTLESLTKNWRYFPMDDINEVEVAPEDRRTDYLWLPENSYWRLEQYEVLSKPVSTRHQPILATFVWHR